MIEKIENLYNEYFKRTGKKPNILKLGAKQMEDLLNYARHKYPKVNFDMGIQWIYNMRVDSQPFVIDLFECEFCEEEDLRVNTLPSYYYF